MTCRAISNWQTIRYVYKRTEQTESIICIFLYIISICPNIFDWCFSLSLSCVYLNRFLPGFAPFVDGTVIVSVNANSNSSMTLPMGSAISR